MSHYDSGYLAEQNLYGSNSGSTGAANAGGQGGGGGYGGGGGGGNQQHLYRQNSHRSGGGRRHDNGGGYGGGARGRGRGGHGQQGTPRREHIDPEEYNIRRLRDTLFRIGDFKEGAGDFHPPSELFRLKEMVEEQAGYGGRSLEGLLSAFRVIAIEQPHKVPLTAALLGFLTLSPKQQVRLNGTEAEGSPASENGNAEEVKPTNYGVMLIKDLVTAFRSHIDARLWRNVRLLLHLFASLLPLGIIRPSTLRSILLSFAAVLEEPGVAAARGDRAAMCIIETMCRAGRDLLDKDGREKRSEDLEELVTKVERYVTEYRHVEVDLVRPVALKDTDSSITGEEDFLHEESLDTSLVALQTLKARQYVRPAFLPSPLDLLPPPIVTIAQTGIDADLVISLPDILVPPDDEFLEGHSLAANSAGEVEGLNVRDRQQHRRDKRDASGEGWYRAGAGVERVPRYAKWFLDTVPSSSSPAGVILRSIFYDIIDLYQVNRKECARILFDSARWLRKGSFVCKSTSPDSGIFGEVDDQWQIADDGTAEGAWNLDEMIVECILSTALVLPVPPQKPLYYTSLLREVVTVNPQSIAPAMGKSVRRLYNLMNTGRVEGETIRRFAEWFSVHLSNFNFNWNWKEWIPDMHLPASSPKLSFARRIIELEIRLAYFDRIKMTLPEEIKDRLLAAEEPSPSFTYGADRHPLRERAVKLIQSLRARATAEVILADLESLKKDISPAASSSFLPPTDEEEDAATVKVASTEQADVVIRDVLIQAILSLGSRSFSHLLNVLEKYHPLLRQMTATPGMRLVVLSSTARFWSLSPQWILICVDKLLQYRLVEPTDVISFVFSPQVELPAIATSGDDASLRDWSTFNWWELIKLTVNKVNGRVDQVQKRLEGLEREELDKAEKQKAVLEAGGEAEDSTMEEKGSEEAKKAALPLFPSGATTSTLPRRPDLPPLSGPATSNLAPPTASGSDNLTDEEKKGKAQSVGETRQLYDNVTKEQRRVLIDVMQGFVTRLRPCVGQVKAWQRGGQEENNDEQWQLWWVISWYREYCRLFSKHLAANHETIVANVFPGNQDDILFTIFDNACQMASE